MSFRKMQGLTTTSIVTACRRKWMHISSPGREQELLHETACLRMGAEFDQYQPMAQRNTWTVLTILEQLSRMTT
jgi:hypothetical protein